jgi:hypothetical protein
MLAEHAVSADVQHESGLNPMVKFASTYIPAEKNMREH